MENENKDVKTIQSVHRALDILEYLISSGTGCKLTEITAECGLNKTTAFHLIKTLETRGYIEQSPDSLKYKTGGKMFELALKSYRSINLNIICQPYLEQLAEQFNETACLYHYAKYNGVTQVLCTLVADATNPVRVSVELGKWLPLLCTGSGKVYLSCLKGDKLEEAIADDPCPAEKKPAADLLKEQLQAIRKNRFCVEISEFQDGVVNIAVPIYKYTGRAIASICVVLPLQRADKEKIDSIVKALLPISETISAMPL